MDKVFVMFDEKPCYALPQLLIRPGMEEKISTKSIRPGNDIDDVLWFKIKLKTFEMK